MKGQTEMRWKIKCTRADGTQIDFGTYGGGYPVKKFDTRDDAKRRVDELTKLNAGHWRYSLVRLVTKREKLKNKLLKESMVYELSAAKNGNVHDPMYTWDRAYARALRDIASQL